MSESANGREAFLFPAKGIAMGDEKALLEGPAPLETYTVPMVRIREERLAGEPPRVRTEFKDLTEIYTLSCAASDLIKSRGHRPAVVSGYSLGIYAALYTAGVYTFEEGLEVLIASVRCVLDFFERDDLDFAMGGIVGLTEEEIRKELFPEIPGRLEIACHNGVRSYVVAGERSSILRCLQAAADLGAFTTVLLETLYGYHMACLEPLASAIRARLEGYSFAEPSCLFLSPLTGEPVAGAALSEEIVRNFHSSVRWDLCMHSLLYLQGVKRAVETGPGDSLTRINRYLERGLDTVHFTRLAPA